MSGMPFYPFFSTTYGDSFGYNEREGSNPHTFRNRYQNADYQGALNTGPTRFAVPYLEGFTQSLPPLTSPSSSHFDGWGDIIDESSFTRSAPLPRRLAPLDEGDSGGYLWPHPPTNTPVPSVSATARSWKPSDGDFASLFSSPSAFSASSSFFNCRDAAAATTTHTVPYPPPRPGSPAQSIPFGRLHAPTRVQILKKEEEAAGVTAALGKRNSMGTTYANKNNDYEVEYNKPGLTFDKSESSRHCGSLSISRRLPERQRLRYHVPGYMGFVRTVQFRHGDTYGKTTRKSVLGTPDLQHA